MKYIFLAFFDGSQKLDSMIKKIKAIKGKVKFVSKKNCVTHVPLSGFTNQLFLEK